jgi:hypothetical protein
VRDYEHSVYYRVIGFTTGIIGALTDTELEIVLSHEMDEVMQTESEVLMNLQICGIANSIDEKERHRKEFEDRFYNKYGRNYVDNCLRKCARLCRAKPIVERVVVLAWITHFVYSNYTSLAGNSIPMPQIMKSREQIQYQSQWVDMVLRLYNYNAPNELYELKRKILSITSETLRI